MGKQATARARNTTGIPASIGERAQGAEAASTLTAEQQAYLRHCRAYVLALAVRAGHVQRFGHH